VIWESVASGLGKSLAVLLRRPTEPSLFADPSVRPWILAHVDTQLSHSQLS
jgi:hypothetical protein